MGAEDSGSGVDSGARKESSGFDPALDFSVRRQSEVRKVPAGLPTPGPWFEKIGRPGVIRALRTSDKLEFNREMIINMLMEAYHREEFLWSEQHGPNSGYASATEADRLNQIAQLNHLASLSGILSPAQLNRIETYGPSWNLPPWVNAEFMLPRPQLAATTWEQVVAEGEQLRAEGKVRGFFHGSFCPPTYLHLGLMNYYRQFCDQLVVGLDTDKYIARYKAGNWPAHRKLHTYDTRAGVLHNFPHVLDRVVELPIEERETWAYVDAYEELRPDIVFFDQGDPFFEQRMNQVLIAGARPFVWHPYGGHEFHASALYDIIAAGKADAYL